MRRIALLALGALGLSTVIVAAQQYGDRVPWCYEPKECPQTPYDGRLTFVRVFFEESRSGRGGFGGFRGRGGGEPAWHHDRPNAERNLSAILREVSYARTFDGPTGGNVFPLSDPEIFRYPVIWLAEPGYWEPNAAEIEALRAYLLKGGFMIFDDFGGWDRDHLFDVMRRVVPDLQPVRLTGAEPIFKAFFDIELDELRINARGRGQSPEYWGLFEDNDPAKRQIVIMNNNNDIGEYMDYEPTGFFAVDLANEAYKLGVNYMVYALTH
jgi:hypothetical protein